MSKVGLILDAHTTEEIKELAVSAEKANFHSVWATELYRTSFQQISAAASVTERIRLGTAVTLAFVRSPLITALSSLDIDEISKGRFILGLGTGAKRTNENFHGVPYGNKPLSRIKECISIIKKFVSQSHTDKEVVFDGEFYKINSKGYKRAFIPVREQIPVYLAGIGSKMARTSATNADGYIGHVVCSRKYLQEVIIPQLEVQGDSKNFTRCSIITCAISDNVELARQHAKATIAFYATVRTYRPPFELHGFTGQTEKIRESFYKKDINGMIENVTDEMVDTFAVVGNARQCRETIDSYREFIDLPILSVPHYFIDFKFVKEYQHALMDAFKS